MAVHRLGLGEHRDDYVGLGHVRVTVDDLESLRELLTSLHGVDGSPTRFEFTNGTFDEPQDLPSLTDDELSFVEVKCGDTEVLLSSSHAGVYGREDICALVRDRWSAGRQTAIRPRVKRRSSKAVARVGLLAVILVLNYIAFISGLYGESHPVWYTLTTGAVTVLALAYFAIQIAKKPVNYAFIFPGSYAEFRLEHRSQQRHSQTILAAYLGITVAVASIVVSIVLNFL